MILLYSSLNSADCIIGPFTNKPLYKNEDIHEWNISNQNLQTLDSKHVQRSQKKRKKTQNTKSTIPEDKGGTPVGIGEVVFRKDVTFELTVEFMLQKWPENVMTPEDFERHLKACFKDKKCVPVYNFEI